jgi:hypothetical protein
VAESVNWGRGAILRDAERICESFSEPNRDIATVLRTGSGVRRLMILPRPVRAGLSSAIGRVILFMDFSFRGLWFVVCGLKWKLGIDSLGLLRRFWIATCADLHHYWLNDTYTTWSD